MRLVAVTAAVSILAASAVAGAARPPVALIASPAHVALAGSARLIARAPFLRVRTQTPPGPGA